MARHGHLQAAAERRAVIAITTGLEQFSIFSKSESNPGPALACQKSSW